MNEVKFEVKTEDEILGEELLKKIEKIGRTCYKSESKITQNSYRGFIKMLIEKEHESVLEHEKISVRIICDRGVSHEIVRHRIGSYSQESTRYCNYSQEKFGNNITVISPSFFSEKKLELWREAMVKAEEYYFKLLELGASPQEARTVLPNSLKTEIVVTYNLREWRHFLKLRVSQAAHPQMREVALSILKLFKEKIPVIFDDIEAKNE